MKLIKKFIALSLITIIVLLSVFYYIDKYILSSDSLKISSEKIDTKSNNANINIPTSAEDIKVSYNGAYVAYNDNGILNIVDTKSGLKKELNLENVSFYNWLPDRNRILVAQNIKKNYSSVFQLDFYDAERDEIGNISDIAAFDSAAEVMDLKVSTLTNVIYIKVGDNNRTKIYYLNIMKKLKKINTQVRNIGNIEVIPSKNDMVYEDSINQRIYVTGLNEPIAIANVTAQSLLGIDSGDNIYIGEIRNNKVVKVYWNSMDKPAVNWNSLAISGLVDKKDIYISGTGGIYVNDSSQNSVHEMKSNKISNYTGKLLRIIDGGLISIDGGKLIVTGMK